MDRENVAGQKFNHLTAVKPVYAGKYYTRYWVFKCDCGKEVESLLPNVKKGNTKSCGCLRKKVSSELHKTHGMTYSKEYYAWVHAKMRCYNKKDKEYKRYGARKIEMCEKWKNSFEKFYKDIGEAPEGTSLDRINNNGNYEPENCHWATPKQQANNRRTSHFVEYRGEKLTLAQWSRRTGIHQENIRRRIDDYGWSIHKTLTTK